MAHLPPSADFASAVHRSAGAVVATVSSAVPAHAGEFSAISAASVVSGFFGWLPPILQTIATLLGIVWFSILIYDYIKRQRVAPNGEEPPHNHGEH